MTTHTAIATTAKGVYGAIQVPTEQPAPDEVLIKVAYASVAGFDVYVSSIGWYVEEYPVGLGLGAAGTVVSVGEGVHDLQIGDRVYVSLAFKGTRARALQEFSVQSRSTVAKIPDNLPFDVAATIPDNFGVGYYTLFTKLSLPVTSFPATTPPPLASTPILVYGGGGSASQSIIQLLRIAGYTNILTTASPKHHNYLISLGATRCFDYRHPQLVEEIAEAVGGDGKVPIVIDGITTETTISTCAKVIRPGGDLALLLPISPGNSLVDSSGAEVYMELREDVNPLPEGVKYVGIRAFLAEEDPFLRENLFIKILPELLQAGLVKPNHVRLIDFPGTLEERVKWVLIW
ncbi:hypothetical protein GALMADRAFT_230938 [Galerina marginata CBS 339.88]|uniref:Enoyl reductase (ER) domain-containing protein n=1 Tax=Galerina marginata (strain CBS 339.88) TaxID=685588 RepID=A0A067SD45_GALM3|nr:hypothetical protein GALMADRAFT_230938 [Galerina marginata CBS 339.88]